MAFNEEPPNNTNSSQEQSQENNIHNQDKYENVSNNESTQNDDSNSSNKGNIGLLMWRRLWLSSYFNYIGTSSLCDFYESLRLNFIK